MSIQELRTTVTGDDLAQAKTSLRIDPDDTFDDVLIRMLIKTARQDIINQVGDKIDDFFDNNDVFTMAVLVEVGHLYNHRDSTSTQEEFEVPMVQYSLINSLKDEYRYRMWLKDHPDQDADEVADDSAAGSDQNGQKGSEDNG